ncbi:RNA polymerase sigma factor [bacterium]|nr:RNA polymerase sigma factor [bacterium]MCI0601607.1 RNA polymerase sigma factor [bacterium]
MNEPASDEVLMLRYKDGDLSAFEVIIEKHQQPLFSFVYRFCNDYHQAQDLVQDVFLRLVKMAKNYEPKAKFTTYLYTIAHNVCIDYLRRKKKRQSVSLSDPIDAENGMTLEETMKDGRANPQRDFQQKSFEQALHQAVEDLPPEQREVFLLREQQNLAFDEIARIVGCLPSTAKSRMRYALQSIREKLQNKFSLADIV